LVVVDVGRSNWFGIGILSGTILQKVLYAALLLFGLEVGDGRF